MAGNRFDLSGRVALAAGGAGAIGRAVVRGLAEHGADLAVADLEPARAESVAAEVRGLGRRGLALGADITDSADAERMVGETLAGLGRLDIFVNAVGGVRIGEPAADLATCLAVVSSLSERAIPGKVVVFGEVGLAGEVRPAPQGQERLKEAAKLGFEKAIVPRANQPKAKIAGLEIVPVERVESAVQLLRDL